MESNEMVSAPRIKIIACKNGDAIEAGKKGLVIGSRCSLHAVKLPDELYIRCLQPSVLLWYGDVGRSCGCAPLREHNKA
ncbi:hypothetical protein J3R82DRAFT_6763 [Butyriboletus roseoflavus]|nr:hypothetical protein J3R82DRAFT_6763 [Butyriboletus roseoflavus]